MKTTDREHAVTRAFVSVANRIADGFDVVDLLSGLTTECTQLLDIVSAGLLLADGNGRLHVLAASNERTLDLEIFQLQSQQGPCLDCYRSGVAVSVADLAEETQRWPEFAPTAVGAGFVSVHALPMRLHDKVLGGLNLFGARTGALRADDLDLAQALADVASIALVADKAASDKDAVNQQLQTALTSRIVIEQAKGILAESGSLDMERSLHVLRRYARDHNERLSHVAALLASRELEASRVLDHAAAKGASGRVK